MRRFIKVCAIVIVVAMMGIIVSSKRTLAGEHYVEILTPYQDQALYDLYYNDYVSFIFKLQNDDNYYLTYDVFIDDNYDQRLNNLGWGIKCVKYDVKDFIANYGRGTHTFTINCYHGIPYVIGLTEGPNPNDDIYWVNEQCYRLILADEISVTFDVVPPLCHFLGFWNGANETEYEYWQSDVMTLHDLLLDDVHAHYIPGHFEVLDFWSDITVQDKIEALDSYEKENDIVIVDFASHGSEKGLIAPQGSAILGHNKLTPAELKNFLSVLDTNNLIIILECCNAGVFIPELSTLSNPCHILAACEECEQSWGRGNVNFETDRFYDPSWSINYKLDHIASVFSYFLINAFFDAKSTTESFDYAYDEVVRETTRRQHPTEYYSLLSVIYLCTK